MSRQEVETYRVLTIEGFSQSGRLCRIRTQIAQRMIDQVNLPVEALTEERALRHLADKVYKDGERVGMLAVNWVEEQRKPYGFGASPDEPDDALADEAAYEELLRRAGATATALTTPSGRTPRHERGQRVWLESRWPATRGELALVMAVRQQENTEHPFIYGIRSAPWYDLTHVMKPGPIRYRVVVEEDLSPYSWR